MKVFDRYIFKNLAIATAFVTLTLVVVVFLSQSLRFLELVIDSGASSGSFWILTLLALPRFFEIIMPLAMMAAAVFIYNRMTMDSEIVVVRSTGYSPYMLARPAIALGLMVTVFLWCMTLYVSPKSMTAMYEMEGQIKTQFSSSLFREGVFNQVGNGNGLTVYIRNRGPDGDLHGIMIYDGRQEAKKPSVIIAKRGQLADADGKQVVVYDGSRQEFHPDTGKLERLNFERYAVDLPESAADDSHWREPDERTIYELFNPNLSDPRDRDALRDFKIEIYRRFASPVLALAFTMIACATLLLGPLDRRGQGKRIAACVIGAALLQGLFIMSYDLSRKSDVAIIFMYVIAFTPLALSHLLLDGYAEKLRARFPSLARSLTS